MKCCLRIFFAVALILMMHYVVLITGRPSDYSEVDDIVQKSRDQGIYTTYSETSRPVHVPVYQRVPVNVPHPVAVAVPNYIRVPIPQPYPNYINVQHKIEVPVFKVVPEIIEKRVPYTVEKPYKVEVEKPYPIEVYKKIEIPVPMPYPVHVVYYKHVSEEDQATNQNKLSNNGYAKSPSVSYSHQQTQNTPLYSNSPSNAYGIQSQSHGVQSHGVQSHGVQSQQYKRDVPSYSNQASYPNRRPMNSNREYSNRNERQPKFYNSEYAGEITPNHERDHHQQRNDKYLYSGY